MNTTSVRIRLQTNADYRVQLVQAPDPFGTEAVVTIDIAPGVTFVVSDPDAAGALAGALSDAAKVLLDEDAACRGVVLV